jgi:putative addiction module antidote
MIALEVTRVGNALGVVLPKDMLARLNVGAGDTLYLTETKSGFRLSPYEPDYETQIAVAEGVLKRRRPVLRDLAK